MIFSVWDTGEDASEFADAFRAFGQAVSGVEWSDVAYSDVPGHVLEMSDLGTVGIWTTGDEVRVIVAPDLRSTKALFSALEFLDPMTDPDGTGK